MCDRSGFGLSPPPPSIYPDRIIQREKLQNSAIWPSSPKRTQHSHGNFIRVPISDTIALIWQHPNSSKLHEELITATEHIIKNTPHSEHSTFTCLCTTEIILSCKVYCHNFHRVIFCTQHSYCLSGRKPFISVS
jgi:hypothetical protein